MYSATIPDLLRLLVVPVLGWAAIRDIKTRRVPNRTWFPLAALGVLLVCWEVTAIWAETVWWLTADGLQIGLEARPPRFDRTLNVFFIRTAFSVGFLVPFAYGFWWFGGFGGADAKALMTLAVVFPVYPTYYFPSFTLPWLDPTTLGVFSLTILSNTVLVGVAYPVVLAVRNAVGRHLSRMMFIGRPLRADRASERYGRLLERPDGYTRHGLDLDALRMYCSWRGISLDDLRADPERYRDPASLPEEPNHPGDGTVDHDGGSIALTDGGPADEKASDMEAGDTAKADDDSDDGDPWGAEQFLDSIEGSAFGTDPKTLREGLTVLTSEEEVWYSPGVPFIVPMFGGLVVSLLVGDVLVWLLNVVGIG